ncbi:mitochondrial cytochrome c oxidase subunit 13 kD [Chlorella sorokiniana]|jgi:cytochrome c oxidase subunit 5b|uniref:Mitochondrial cytochrome c oxidase subunit 13 kD n=1 Tax=Chlorella sorokiniana TaxID=3076 RepID=A0A2P6THQ1_CHLSO|nr:mitochondrial cytochrome c oxidase subunit 13 kD [Chlorella sorokiniana]|eukprot:PRW33809.1 mitochondrial cytochrome c oxidase subunit 13 kD [Chlorella sorokiniana]
MALLLKLARQSGLLKAGAAGLPLAAGALAAKRGFAAVTKDELADYLEQTTGPERDELEAKAKGIENPWHEAWLDAPFGTEENPVVVPSEFTERIVGVSDPDDDSLVWWGVIEDGQPPKQIIEGGEFFVLKRVPATSAHH